MSTVPVTPVTVVVNTAGPTVPVSGMGPVENGNVWALVCEYMNDAHTHKKRTFHVPSIVPPEGVKEHNAR